MDRQRKWALLAGISKYPKNSGFLDLRTPSEDTVGLARCLQHPDCGFNVVRLDNPSNTSLQRSIEELFKSASREDLVVLYFSGHGKTGNRGQLYLCASNTEEQYVSSTGVGLSWLRERIDEFKISQVVIILDCCFSGAAQVSFKGDLSSLLEGDLGKGSGKYLITSSNNFQVSIERPEDAYSLFTKWLIHGLEMNRADSDGDGIVTVDEIFQYAFKNVQRENPDQTPQSKGFEITPGRVIFSKIPTADARPRPFPYPGPDFVGAVRKLTNSGRVVPVVGLSVYGSIAPGPLALTEAVARAGPIQVERNQSLAMTAEHLELFQDRASVLGAIRECVAAGAASAEALPLWDLIAGMKPLPLVVSATYDDVLERKFRKAAIPFVTVAHILRSKDGARVGRMVAARDGQAPQVLEPDRFLVKEDEVVIYKIVGAPYLNDLMNAAEETDPDETDTVVVTETDHATLLALLKNRETETPAEFARMLTRRFMLFLGYPLDVWHYRLVVQAFGRSREHKSFAVRQPTSAFEEEYWKKLKADMIRMDVLAFAEAMAGGVPSATA